MQVVIRLLAISALAVVTASVAAPAIAKPRDSNPLGLPNRTIQTLAIVSPEFVDALFTPAGFAVVQQMGSPYQNSRVARIGERLRSHASRRDIRFFGLRSSIPNACCSFGGNIYVFDGLLQLVGDDDDAFAACMAHEVGHAQRYHTARNLSQMIAVRRLSGKLSGQPSQESLRQMLQELGRAAYTRESEREADNDAIRLMVAAGYDPNGVIRFFNLLSGLNVPDKGLLNDHPMPEDRIRRLRDFARTLGVDLDKPSVRNVGAPGAPDPASGATESTVGSGNWRRLSREDIRRQAESSAREFGLSFQFPDEADVEFYMPPSNSNSGVTVLRQQYNGKASTDEMLGTLRQLSDAMESAISKRAGTFRLLVAPRELARGSAVEIRYSVVLGGKTRIGRVALCAREGEVLQVVATYPDGDPDDCVKFAETKLPD